MEGPDRELRRYRRRIATVAVPGLTAVLTAVVATYPPTVMRDEIAFALSYGILQFIIVSSFLAFCFGIVMLYLQTGFRRRRTPPEQVEQPPVAKEIESAMQDVIGRLASLENRQTSEGTFLEVSDELVHRLRKSIDEKATEQYLEEIRAGIRAEDARKRRMDAVDRLDTTIWRLNEERDALSWRGNFNLALGSIVGGIGMGVLAYFVINMTGDSQDGPPGWEFVRRFLPQLSLVTLVEVFAYFFLRLYSRSLTEIKYFQNEISNFEAKLASLRTALETADEDLLRRVVLELARTERNHILRKGETTVATEQAKADEATLSLVTEALSKALKSDRTQER